MIRIGVYEETGKLIGHRVLAVEALRPGELVIPLPGCAPYCSQYHSDCRSKGFEFEPMLAHMTFMK